LIYNKLAKLVHGVTATGENAFSSASGLAALLPAPQSMSEEDDSNDKIDGPNDFGADDEGTGHDDERACIFSIFYRILLTWITSLGHYTRPEAISSSRQLCSSTKKGETHHWPSSSSQLH